MYSGIIAPDKGSVDRASAVARDLGLPVYFGEKTRDVETGRLTGFIFPDVHVGHRYLVVDDICDGGGTFIGLAADAPHDVFLDLYVTHGLFTKGTEALSKSFGRLYCRFVYGDLPKGVRLVGENY
jgi:ribose-phosphate pyrophosphokinase